MFKIEYIYKKFRVKHDLIQRMEKRSTATAPPSSCVALADALTGTFHGHVSNVEHDFGKLAAASFGSGAFDMSHVQPPSLGHDTPTLPHEALLHESLAPSHTLSSGVWLSGPQSTNAKHYTRKTVANTCRERVK